MLRIMAGSTVICEFYGNLAPDLENAAFIVKACNNHERLVAALHRLSGILNAADMDHEDFADSGADVAQMVCEITPEIRSLLSQLNP